MPIDKEVTSRKEKMTDVKVSVDGAAEKAKAPQRRQGRPLRRRVSPEMFFRFERTEAVGRGKYRRASSADRNVAPTRFRAPGLFARAGNRLYLSWSADIGTFLKRPDTPPPWTDVCRVDIQCLAGSPCLTCAVCLDEEMVAPRITRCGHVFCLPCIYRSIHEKALADCRQTCPVCSVVLTEGFYELKPARFQVYHPIAIGSKCSFCLLGAQKGVPVSLPIPLLGPRLNLNPIQETLALKEMLIEPVMCLQFQNLVIVSDAASKVFLEQDLEQLRAKQDSLVGESEDLHAVTTLAQCLMLVERELQKISSRLERSAKMHYNVPVERPGANHPNLNPNKYLQLGFKDILEDFAAMNKNCGDLLPYDARTWSADKVSLIKNKAYRDDVVSSADREIRPNSARPANSPLTGPPSRKTLRNSWVPRYYQLVDGRPAIMDALCTACLIAEARYQRNLKLHGAESASKYLLEEVVPTDIESCRLVPWFMPEDADLLPLPVLLEGVTILDVEEYYVDTVFRHNNEHLLHFAQGCAVQFIDVDTSALISPIVYEKFREPLEKRRTARIAKRRQKARQENKQRANFAKKRDLEWKNIVSQADAAYTAAQQLEAEAAREREAKKQEELEAEKNARTSGVWRLPSPSEANLHPLINSWGPRKSAYPSLADHTNSHNTSNNNRNPSNKEVPISIQNRHLNLSPHQCKQATAGTPANMAESSDCDEYYTVRNPEAVREDAWNAVATTLLGNLTTSSQTPS